MLEDQVQQSLTEKIGTNEALSEDEISRLLYNGKRTFQQRYGTWPGDFGYTVGTEEVIRPDPETNTIEIGPVHSALGYSKKERLVSDAIKELYDMALETVATDRADIINDRYDFIDAEPRVEEVYFDLLKTEGSYNSNADTIAVDFQYFDELDLDASASNELDALLDHELTHALHYEHSNALKAFTERISNDCEEIAYKNHPDRASLEAIAQYEQHTTLDRVDRLEAIKNVLTAQPDAISITLSQWADYGDTLIEDPYEHGMVAAAVVDTATDTAEETRKELLRIRDAAGIEGLIENRLEEMGIPSYIGPAKDIRNVLENASAPERCAHQYLTQVLQDPSLEPDEQEMIHTATADAMTDLDLDPTTLPDS